jgi:hypothetical protein
MDYKYTWEYRGNGYYWIVANNRFRIGIWNGSCWIIHNDPHEYNDLELDAILPIPIELDNYIILIGAHIQKQNDEQKKFFFHEPIEKKIQFTPEEVDELIEILKSKRWQK